MNIATIQQANDIGCCCPMPECPGNRWKRKDREATPYNYFFVPFIKPSEEDSTPLADADPIPTLYDDSNNKDFLGHTGQAVWYEGWKVNPTDSTNKAELRQVLSVNYDPLTYEPLHGWMALASIFRESNSITNPPSNDITYTPEHDTVTDPAQVYDIIWTSLFTTSAANAYNPSEADHTVVAVPEHWDVTADKWQYYPDAIKYYTEEAATLSLQGWPGDMNETSYYFDVTITRMDQIELTGPIDQEGFIGDCTLDLTLEDWPADEATDQPEAETNVYHRRYMEGGSYVDQDRWPAVGDANPWPAGPSYGIETHEVDRPVEFRVHGFVHGVKYRVGIPYDWEVANAALLLWQALHDAWELEDPEERGEEPVKPDVNRRSVFECQWQEVFFPKEWEIWREAHAAWKEDHDDWKVDHAEWVTDHHTWENTDPETRGDEPTEPTEPVETIEKPTDPLYQPVLLHEREWTYGGPGTDAFSEEFEMPPPTLPGAVRPVNMMIICYHASRVGVKPTLHGEFVNLADP